MKNRKFRGKTLNFLEEALSGLQAFLENEKSLGRVKTKLPGWVKSKLKQSFVNGIEIGRKHKSTGRKFR